MVLLQAAELLPQRLQLCLQVRPAQRQLVQHLAQPVDVGLHALAQGQLRLIPGLSESTDSGWGCPTWALCQDLLSQLHVFVLHFAVQPECTLPWISAPLPFCYVKAFLPHVFPLLLLTIYLVSLIQLHFCFVDPICIVLG